MKRFVANVKFGNGLPFSLLLIVWAYVNYHLKIYVLISLMVVFCILLCLNSRPSILYIAIPVLFVVLVFTQSPLAWLNLKHTNQKLATDFISKIGLFMTPNSGKEILPQTVQNILALIDKYDIQSYRVTDNIAANTLIYQRTIESTWPITENPDSHYLLGFIGDITHYNGCLVIEQRYDVELGSCQ